MFDLSGRTAIVTGAGRGLGRAHAIYLAGRGCAVLVNDPGGGTDGQGSDSGPADEVVAQIGANGGKAIASYGSVTSQPDVSAMVEAAANEFGGIDIVVNNAGIEYPTVFDRPDMELIRRLFEVHVFGSIMVTSTAWPHLIKSGSGRVINTVSAAMYGMPERTGYGAAKGALLGFTRNLAVDGETYGIKVNATAPIAGTRMAENSTIPKEVRDFMMTLPPELVSPAIAYLAHPDCAVNGETFVLGGGKIGRLALSEGAGITSAELSPEMIAKNMGKLLDPADLTVVTRILFGDES